MLAARSRADQKGGQRLLTALLHEHTNQRDQNRDDNYEGEGGEVSHRLCDDRMKQNIWCILRLIQSYYYVTLQKIGPQPDSAVFSWGPDANKRWADARVRAQSTGPVGRSHVPD
jgi:hypothetical protein